MTMHKFLSEETGTVFYYDNVFNGLYDSGMKRLSKEHGLPEKYVNFVHRRNADSFKEIKKSNQPAMMKIILGHGCNYSCGYCMQDELSNKGEGAPKQSTEEKTQELIRNIQASLDLSQIERIELWGGEAFLYFQEIKGIMNALDREGLTWYIPTNGTLINREHLAFLKERKGTICFGISHDGPAHEKTRGREFLHRQVEILREMQSLEPKIQFSFNPVISSENCDLFAINDFFIKFLRANGLRNVPLMFEIIQVYQLAEVRGTSKSFAIRPDQLEGYRKNLSEYLAAHGEQFRRLGPERVAGGDLLITNLFELYGGSIPYARMAGKEDVKHSGAKCQADQEKQLTIDMKGNVRTCQNVGKEASYGNINDISKVAVKNIDTNQGEHCGECRVRFLCSSQCPISQNKEVFNTNCRINKVHYGAIQDAAYSYLFKSSVKWMGTVDGT